VTVKHLLEETFNAVNFQD